MTRPSVFLFLFSWPVSRPELGVSGLVLRLLERFRCPPRSPRRWTGVWLWRCWECGVGEARQFYFRSGGVVCQFLVRLGPGPGLAETSPGFLLFFLVARLRRDPTASGLPRAKSAAKPRHEKKKVNRGEWCSPIRRGCRTPHSYAIASNPRFRTITRSLRDAPAGCFSPRSHWLTTPGETLR